MRTFSIGFDGGVVRRARRCARRLGALRDAASRAHPPPRRGAAPPGARRCVRRAVRGLVGPPDLPRLAARGRGREGRAVGRGRRRALRRLLHVRRRPARRPLRAGGGACAPGDRAPAVVEPQGEPRLQGEAVRAGGASAAARATPRVEGDLLGRRARRADRTAERVRPGRHAASTRSPRPKGTSCSHGCRTSTSASTWSTTCW